MRRQAALAILAAMMLSSCGEPAPAEKTDAGPGAAAEQSAVMPEDAPPQEEAAAETAATESGAPTAETPACVTDIGAAAAAKLVKRCIAVSPATHPPCNAQNPCALIQGEIDRSCAMYGPGETKPRECEA